MQADVAATPQNIPLGAIHVALGHNPRKFFKASDFDRLVESIRENDLLTPILVRPQPRLHSRARQRPRRCRCPTRCAYRKHRPSQPVGR